MFLRNRDIYALLLLLLLLLLLVVVVVVLVLVLVVLVHKYISKEISSQHVYSKNSS